MAPIELDLGLGVNVHTKFEENRKEMWLGER